MILKIFAKILNNVGLGIFINSLYGISDGSIELFNIMSHLQIIKNNSNLS